MNTKRIAVWAALFFSLLIFVLVVDQQPRQPGKQTSEPSAPRIFTCPADDLQDILLTRHARTLRLMKTARGWTTEPPCNDKVTQDHLTSFVTTLLDTPQLEVVARNGAAREQFGLTTPWARIVVRCKGINTDQELLLGALTPSQVSLYAQIQGQDSIFLVGTYLSFSLNTLMDAAGLK